MVLNLLEPALRLMGIKFITLTGSTPVEERQSLVDDFSEDDSITVFLLSPRAGGMGINLVAANVVIIFDADFNPHSDRQAMDRAYRIGQTRDVNVIRLITRGTIEVRVSALTVNFRLLTFVFTLLVHRIGAYSRTRYHQTCIR